MTRARSFRYAVLLVLLGAGVLALVRYTGCKGEKSGGQRPTEGGKQGALETSPGLGSVGGPKRGFPTNISSGAVDITVELNGFPVFSHEDGLAHSKIFNDTRQLKDGTNELSVAYAVRKDFDPKKHGKPRLSINISQRELAEDYYANFGFPLEVDGGTLHHGSLSENKCKATFELVDAQYLWEFEFSQENSYDYIPFELAYYSTTVAVDEMTIEFSNSADTHVVVYENVSIEKAVKGTVDFTALTPASGGQWVNSGGFCKIKFSYEEPEEALSWDYLTFRRTRIEQIFELKFPPRDMILTKELIDRGTLVKGSGDEWGITFEFDDVNDVWVWELEFAEEDEYSRVPSRIGYFGKVASSDIDIEFSNDSKSHVVTYEGLSCSANEHGSIDLYDLTPDSGAAHLFEDDFSRIKLSYALPDNDLQWTTPLLRMERLELTKTFSFSADVSQTWLWEDAESVTTLTNDDKTAIAAVVSALHTAMDGEDAAAAAAILEYRTKDAAKAMYEVEATCQQQQEDALDQLFEIEDWDMEPLDTDYLVYDVLSNKKMVHVTYDEKQGGRKCPIQSVSLTINEGEKNEYEDQATIDVFFSKIKVGETYEWHIIQ